MVAPSDSIESIFSFASASMIQIGSCTPLSTIQNVCEELAKETAYKRTALPIHDMLRWFASTQIRNVACLGGNLVTASPISDMNPMLAAMGAALVLASVGDDNETLVEKLGGSNEMGPILHDEILFLPPGEKVLTVGQVLGIAVAETLDLAEKAARAVEVTYGPCDEKIIVSIEDAIEAKSFFEASRHTLQ